MKTSIFSEGKRSSNMHLRRNLFPLRKISHKEFSKMFKERHEFGSEEQMNLSKRYKHTKFFDIPLSWIVLIDKMMEQIYQINKQAIKCVYQSHGFLIVMFININETISKIIKNTEKNIYAIDVDLHMQLSGVDHNQA